MGNIQIYESVLNGNKQTKLAILRTTASNPQTALDAACEKYLDGKSASTMYVDRQIIATIILILP